MSLEKTAELAGRSEASFSFKRLIVRKAYFEQADPEPSKNAESQRNAPGTGDLELTLQLRLNETEGMVTLGTILRPDRSKKPYRVEVIVSGIFASPNASASVFHEFAQKAAPSILFPYVRQLIHSLTADAAYGPIRINPINIQQLVAKGWDRSEPTASSEPPQPSSQ